MFYVMYNLSDYEIVGVSGPPYSHIPENCGIAEISDEDGIDFTEGNKRFIDYYVLINDGVGEFILKDIKSLRKRFAQYNGENLVRDLDLKDAFFDILKIEYTIKEGKLNLLMSKTANEALNLMKVWVSDYNIEGTIYITKFMDPLNLIKKYRFSINNFFDDKVLTLDFNSTEKISVWGTRKNI